MTVSKESDSLSLNSIALEEAINQMSDKLIRKFNKFTNYIAFVKYDQWTKKELSNTLIKFQKYKKEFDKNL